eukprot:13699058-Alexandrium_andersonii.AAC.1
MCIRDRAKGKSKGKGDGGGKGRGKGKRRRTPSADVTAPPMDELFWETLLEPVEAPSSGEAVAPSP